MTANKVGLDQSSEPIRAVVVTDASAEEQSSSHTDDAGQAAAADDDDKVEASFQNENEWEDSFLDFAQSKHPVTGKFVMTMERLLWLQRQEAAYAHRQHALSDDRLRKLQSLGFFAKDKSLSPSSPVMTTKTASLAGATPVLSTTAPSIHHASTSKKVTDDMKKVTDDMKSGHNATVQSMKRVRSESDADGQARPSKAACLALDTSEKDAGKPLNVSNDFTSVMAKSATTLVLTPEIQRLIKLQQLVTSFAASARPGDKAYVGIGLTNLERHFVRDELKKYGSDFCVNLKGNLVEIALNASLNEGPGLVTCPTQSDSSSHTLSRTGNGAQIWVVNSQYKKRFHKYQSMPKPSSIGAMPSVERNGQKRPMCISYHVRGQCSASCKRSYDHKLHSLEEDEQLASWCAQAFTFKHVVMAPVRSSTQPVKDFATLLDELAAKSAGEHSEKESCS
ncbi:hypothetical protein MPSEU_000583300 [Mayamaea pseudoterrestris]|nr:hypothetical protein MPSEU_000583300 [Mayamaea pseudoterrestris]